MITQVIVVNAALWLAMVTVWLSGALMKKYDLAVVTLNMRRWVKHVSLHALALAPIMCFAWTFYASSTKSVFLILIAATLLILSAMDWRHRQVPESLIFFLGIICAAGTVLGQSEVRQDVAFTGMLCVASTLALVMQVMHLQRRFMQIIRIAPCEEQSQPMLGSGDTLVLISIAGFVGVNILYVVFIAAICSFMQGIFTRIVVSLESREIFERREYAFIPSIYVGFVATVILEPLMRAHHIDTLNSLTVQIFR